MTRITKPAEPFTEFPKIPRMNREVIVTEKIDGTNATVYITPEGTIHAASRSKWIDEADDNHGFARWVADHAEELKALGPGLHRGEWHGPGINREHYGLPKGEKRFCLFNTSRWTAETPPPGCCVVVPILYRGNFDSQAINALVDDLRSNGSRAYPGQPAEGVVVYHIAGNLFFKVTCNKDHEPKGQGKLEGVE